MTIERLNESAGSVRWQRYAWLVGAFSAVILLLALVVVGRDVWVVAIVWFSLVLFGTLPPILITSYFAIGGSRWQRAVTAFTAACIRLM